MLRYKVFPELWNGPDGRQIATWNAPDGKGLFHPVPGITCHRECLAPVISGARFALWFVPVCDIMMASYYSKV